MNNETEQLFLLTPSTSQQSSASQKMLIDLPGTTQVNLENVEDFSNVCRTCATITEFVIPIFAGEGLQNSLADKIHKHLPIQVCEQDVLPRVVCYQCASTLLAWHELVACCEQADAALRSRLARATPTPQESKCIANQQKSSTEEDSQSKFEDIANIVETLAPPRLAAAPPADCRPCDFCDTELAEASYKEHLVTAHADMLFHCEECDKYIDRKDFILHMSLHAVQYTTDNDKRDIKKIKKVKKRKRDESTDSNTDVDKRPPKFEDRQENEFSDHSDTEDGFGPLPESVFEAIEDSQDSQPADEEPIIAESENCDTNSQPQAEAENTEKVKVKSHKKTRTCPICSKVYTASSSYFYHLKYSHNKSKDHECDVCGRKFGTKASLAQHALLHSGECQYECKECKKRFRSKASLYIHEQTHNGVKTWSCQQCHKSFRWRTHLLRHVKRHSGEKVHSCAACGRGFSVRCDLLRHARTHAAGRHACGRCGDNFAQLRYLKVHMEKKHLEAAKESHCV